jgi:hypothetical protein
MPPIEGEVVNRNAIEQNTGGSAAANLSPEEQQRLQQVAENNPEAAKYRKLKPKQFFRSDFVIGPGERTQERTRYGIARERGVRTRLREEPGPDDSLVDFEGTEAHRIFNRYATDRINNLAGLAAREGGNYLQRVLNSNLAFGNDRRFIEACADTTTDSNGRIVAIKFNQEKLDKFLNTVEGYNYIAADMEKTAILTELGLNMQATVLPEQERRALNQQMRALFGPPGVAGRLADAFYYLNWQVPENIWNAFHSTGVDFDRIESQYQIIAQMQQVLTDADQDYLFSLYGINIRALTPSGTPQRGVRQDELLPEQYYNPATGRIEVYTTNVLDQEQALKRAANAIKGKKLFLAELGINTGGSAEQYIFQGREQMERVPTLYNQQLMQEYEQEAELEANRLGAPLTEFQRAYIKNRVRMRIMCETVESYARKAMHEKIIARDDAHIREKLLKRRDKAEKDKIAEERTKERKRRKEELAADQQKVEQAKTEVLNPMDATREAVASMENSLIREFNLSLSADLSTELGNLIRQREDLLNNTNGTPPGILKRITDEEEKTLDVYQNLPQVIAAAADAHNRRWSVVLARALSQGGGKQTINAPAFDPKPYQENAKQQEEIHNRLITQLEQRKTKIEAEIANLKAKQDAYIQALAAKEQADRKAYSTSPTELRDATDAYTALRNGNIVTDDDIRDRSVDELVNQIRGIATFTNDAQRRTAVLRAKAERIRRDSENRNPYPAIERNALTLLTNGTGLTESDILTLSPVEISNRLTAQGVNATRADYQLAYALVNKRFKMLYGTRVDLDIGDLKGKVTAEQKAIDEVDKTLDREEMQLEIAQDLRKPAEREAVRGRAREIVTNPANFGPGNLQDQLSDSRYIRNDDTRYSESERRQRELPAAYVAWMNVLYPHYEGAVDENERFDALYAMLPPRELAVIIDTTLGLGVGTDNLRDVLRRLRTVFPNRTPVQFEQAFAQILNRIQEKARAI